MYNTTTDNTTFSCYQTLFFWYNERVNDRKIHRY